MIAGDCGAIPVVSGPDHGTPLGMITDRDIACRGVAVGKGATASVRECMTANIATIGLDDSIEDCCQTMEDNQVRRLLVVDEQGKLCGIVSQADLALHAEGKTAELVKEVSKPSAESSLIAAGTS